MIAYPAHDRTRFSALVAERYVKKLGLVASTALTLIAVRSGVSLGTCWTAYRGYRISADTALRLKQWAFAEHGIEDLDVEHLVTAPPRPKRGAR